MSSLALPPRVQLSRAKGFRLQEHAPGAIVVRRPTRWGNPFTVADAIADDPALTVLQARKRCTECFDLWLDGEIALSSLELTERRIWILGHVDELEGLPLACTCPLAEPGVPDWCHGAVLIRRANRPRPFKPGPVGECGDGYASAAPVVLRVIKNVIPAGAWAGAL